MKGILFNLLEQVVSAEHGDDAWDDLLEAAELDGVYTSLGSYTDEEFAALVAAASRRLRIPASDVLRWFGRQAMALLAEAYPLFFSAHTTTRAFLGSLNDVIHPEVKKLYPGAYTPTFTFSDQADGSLLIGYDSKRDLCHMAEGMILGAGQLYGERVSVVQTACRHAGEHACVLHCRFNGPDAESARSGLTTARVSV